MKKYSVDRIENDIAVSEDENGNIVNIRLSELPSDVKEGDILSFNGEKYAVLYDETEQRRKALLNLQKSLFDN